MRLIFKMAYFLFFYYEYLEIGLIYNFFIEIVYFKNQILNDSIIINYLSNLTNYFINFKIN
jgi:hypothetical protein